MERLFDQFANTVALTLEATSIALIAIGGIVALVDIARALKLSSWTRGSGQAFRGLARWVLLGLEFTLAADVVRTAIAPNWMDIGQLGAIAVIRTFLNYFLERDLERIATTEARPRTASMTEAT